MNIKEYIRSVGVSTNTLDQYALVETGVDEFTFHDVVFKDECTGIRRKATVEHSGNRLFIYSNAYEYSVYCTVQNDKVVLHMGGREHRHLNSDEAGASLFVDTLLAIQTGRVL